MSFVLWSHLFYINLEAALLVYSNTSVIYQIDYVKQMCCYELFHLLYGPTQRHSIKSYISTVFLCC